MQGRRKQERNTSRPCLRLQEAEREIAAANERAKAAEQRADAADQQLAAVAASLRWEIKRLKSSVLAEAAGCCSRS